jgi:HEAT repeat protein
VAPFFDRFRLRAALTSAAIWGAAAPAWAETPLPVNVPAGTGQQALSVFVSKGDVVVAACAAAPCSAGAVALNVPASLRGKPMRAEVVSIAAGRRAVVVTVGGGAPTFQAVVAAPLAPGAPEVAFAGLVGLVNGQPGTQTGPMVQVSEADANGFRRVVVGEQYESVSLCGRPTLLAPRVMSPNDLKLHDAKMQRLSVAERDRARQVKAVRMADDEPSHAASGVLTTLAASSALGPFQALTDGNPETTWSENVGGDGKGEFVVMHAPPELPISGLELLVRPQAQAPAEGAAPETLFIAGPKELVEVTLPEDAWKTPGARYRITLDPPLQSSCLALVLDRAFTQSKTAQVTLAELSVVSELGESQLPALVAALAGGGQRAEAAKALLAAGGAPAFTAVAQAFESLDEGGRRVALEVMDQAPCELSAPVFVTALTGKIEAHVHHAQSRLARCGAAGGEALARALEKTNKTDKRLMPLLVTQLTLTDPARAVRAFMPLMDEKTVARRRLLRTALAQAAKSEAAGAAVRATLADPVTPEVALVDLLRALGEQAPRFQPEAGQALARLSQGSPSFRTRYLLLGPSAVLSGASKEADQSFRRSLASDPDPHVRAAALSLVNEPPRYQAELLKALDDKDMRVREASVRALAAPQATFARPALTTRLKQDEWPLIRAAAADALARSGRNQQVDQSLTEALLDDSALVRARSVRALGERRAQNAAGRIRDHLADKDEWPEVRAEAARALGALCDHESSDMLLAFAKVLADPMASPDSQLIATGAVMSLGRLAEPNLAQQLAPLTGKKASPQARRAAAAALSTRDTCKAKP